MTIFFLITLFLLLAYGILIEYYRKSWISIPAGLSAKTSLPSSLGRVSVIIPARNEQSHIGKCLDSLLAQTFPKSQLEIIVVDDYSTDQTAAIVGSYPEPFIKLIRLRDHMEGELPKAYKKKALEIAIAQASGDWIMTTDADCTHHPNWVQAMVGLQGLSKAVFIAAPVRLVGNRSPLLIFQTLDFICLQGITGASIQGGIHALCNGANLGYLKTAFYEVGGFSGIDHISSGDDMLLMQKFIRRFPGRIFYLKSLQAMVTTEYAGSWGAFLQQRIRWSSKATHYGEPVIFFTLLLVWLLNACLLSFLVAGCFQLTYLRTWLILVVIKTILEFPFAWVVARFFSQQQLMAYFFFAQPFHILYTVIVGLWGQFGRFTWKDRKMN